VLRPALAQKTGMKHLALAFLCLAGPAVAEEPLGFTDFHSVELRNDVVAEVRVADTFAVTVGGADADISNLISAQFGEWLRLDRNKRWLIWTNGRRDQFEATIDMPVVRELKVLSGAVVSADLGMQDRFRAEAEDGMITVSVDTPRLRIRGNDGAVISVSGTCGRLTMLARPTSTVDLSALTCDSIVIFGDACR